MATLTKAKRPKLPKNKLEPPSPSQESLLIVPRVPVVRVAQSDIFERTRQLEASLAAARKLEEKRFLQQTAINRVSSDEVPTVPCRSLVRRAFDFIRQKFRRSSVISERAAISAGRVPVTASTPFKRTFLCHIDKCYKVFEAEKELKKLHVKKRPKRDPSPKAACDASQRDQEFNASNVVKLLSQRFPIQQSDDKFTDAEETICNSIIGYICDVQEAQESLIYDLLDGDKENVSSDSSEDYSAEEVARSSQRLRYTRKQMEDIIKDCDLYGLPYVQHRYGKINSRNDIVRMRQYLEGSVRLAEAEVKKGLSVAFEDWMNKGYHINDRDLHLEAVEIARRKNHIHFKASPHFIFRFKKKYRIVSRKITHVTTKKSFVDRERQREICEKFRNEMKSLIANHTDKGKIFNSDQTGLRLELRSGRTLAYKGSRHIEVLVQRKNALTHSLTLQPVISADSYLQTPMLVCFMERKPPASFHADLQEFKYFYCVSSCSGLMTSQLACEWIRKVFLPNGGENSVLIVVSWGGYHQAAKQFGNRTRRIEFTFIPPRTTADLQPLDVFFNRQIKSFHRHFTELLTRIRPQFIVSIRLNIAKMLNFLVCQFTAPRFQQMILLAWKRAGFIDGETARFLTPEAYCFNFSDDDSVCFCRQPVVFRCAHCSQMFCIDHTIVVSCHMCE